MFSSIKRYGFTLAEALLTLTIIGVIAAMVMPTLINDYNRKVAETRLKKTYSIATNLCERVMADENAQRFTETSYYNPPQNINRQEILTNYIKAISINNDGTTINLEDGSILVIRLFQPQDADAPVLGFNVETNGNTLPNAGGRDQFTFYLNNSCTHAENANDNTTNYLTFEAAMNNDWRLPKFPVQP